MKQKPNKAAAADDDVFVVGGEGGNGDDHDLYDHPPPSSGSRRINLTSTVPLAAKAGGNKSDDESYDVPPSALERTHGPRRRPDRPDSQASSDDQMGGPNECYDYPPRRIGSTTSSDNELVGPVPPARPPKPGHLLSQYQNLPSRKSEAGKLAHGNSLRGHPSPPVNTDPADLMNMVMAPPKPHVIRQGSGYDVPRSSGHRPIRSNQQRSTVTSTITSTNVVPPPPVPRRPSESGSPAPLYLNTPDTGDSAVSENGTVGDATDSALGLVPPAIPPPRHGSSGESQDSRSDRDSPQPVLQSPPVPSTGPAVPPARPPGRAPAPSVSPRSHDTVSEHRGSFNVSFCNQFAHDIRTY